MAMAKIHVALDEQQVRELTAIEEATDRPRTRIIRRAISDYLLKYRAEHPGFAEKLGLPAIQVERELKPGLRLDTIVIRGIKTTAVLTEDGGWRPLRDEDYIDEPGGSVIDL